MVRAGWQEVSCSDERVSGCFHALNHPLLGMQACRQTSAVQQDVRVKYGFMTQKFL